MEAHFNNYDIEDLRLTKTGIDVGIALADGETFNEDTTLVLTVHRGATTYSSDDDDDSDDTDLII